MPVKIDGFVFAVEQDYCNSSDCEHYTTHPSGYCYVCLPKIEERMRIYTKTREYAEKSAKQAAKRQLRRREIRQQKKLTHAR